MNRLSSKPNSFLQFQERMRQKINIALHYKYFIGKSASELLHLVEATIHESMPCPCPGLFSQTDPKFMHLPDTILAYNKISTLEREERAN